VTWRANVSGAAGVLESLRKLTVEELEEDGSGMFYSDSSSIASSNTAG